jgi:hypothetical protein
MKRTRTADISRANHAAAQARHPLAGREDEAAPLTVR